MNEIFVYIEQNKIIRDVSKELLATARSLGGEVCAILLGNFNFEYKELYEAGADKIYHIKHEKLNKYNTKYFANSIIQLINEKNPKIVLIGATKQGRSLAPSISSKLNTGLTADCTKLEIINHKGEDKLASTRPTFGGSLMATILCKNYPQMATVRENVLKKLPEPYKKEGIIEEFHPNLDNINSNIEILDFIENLNKNTDNLTNAHVILSGGLGLKNKENFEKLEELARLIGTNCAVGATRPAVDKGYAQKNKQIGQTGKTVAPKIYIAFGISGAIQHLVGIENSDFIIAINNDKNAPIFENCNIKIVQDAEFVLNSLLDEMRKRKI